MNILVIQSNYIPWKGYFDNIAKADIFVVHDNMQYTKQDWRNRNLIKTNTGLKWLTIPVEAKGSHLKTINDTLIADNNWKKKHLIQLRENYAKAACFKEMINWVEEIYMTAEGIGLSSINIHLLKKICYLLKIDTPFINSMDLKSVGDPTERLVNICMELNGDRYITGPAAKNYLNEDLFKEKGIEIEYVDYSGYPEYQQPYPPFNHSVSILDMIFNCGTNSVDYMKYIKK